MKNVMLFVFFFLMPLVVYADDQEDRGVKLKHICEEEPEMIFHS